MSDLLKKRMLLGFVVMSFIGLFFFDPITQKQAYHNFADKRPIFGMTNSFDVLSNLPFIFSGLFGIFTLINFPPAIAKKSWFVFFIGVCTVAPGSAWYHNNPNDVTLVWDRLPMTIAFMGLFTAMIATYINEQLEKILLPFTVLFGFASVLIWHFTGDLRVYYYVQFIPLAVIPLVIVMFKSQHIRPMYLGGGLLFYLIAKIVEFNDGKIFMATSGMISGHTIKHLAAAIAPLAIAIMFRKKRLHSSSLQF